MYGSNFQILQDTSLPKPTLNTLPLAHPTNMAIYHLVCFNFKLLTFCHKNWLGLFGLNSIYNNNICITLTKNNDFKFTESWIATRISECVSYQSISQVKLCPWLVASGDGQRLTRIICSCRFYPFHNGKIIGWCYKLHDVSWTIPDFRWYIIYASWKCIVQQSIGHDHKGKYSQNH